MIEVINLCKTYKDKKVVDNLSLQVKSGEVFGFLGPNGAGKSTTIKMLLGLIKPSAGTIKILGGQPQQPQVRAQIGFLPEQFRFQTWMTANEFLKFQGKLAGINNKLLQQRIPLVLKQVGLDNRGNDLLSSYSKGMLQRCGLAASMLAQPKLIFLDEPTSALDPIGRVEVRQIIEQLKEQGTTIFLNSHLLSEVEQVCDHVAFIKNGRVIKQGSMEELSGNKIQLDIKIKGFTNQLKDSLSSLGPIIINQSCDLKNKQSQDESLTRIEISLISEEQIPLVVKILQQHNSKLYSLIPEQQNLEQIFLRLVNTQELI